MLRKTIVFCLLSLVARADEPYNSFIEKWEGRRHKIYIDSLGNPSIGVGFNLKTTNENLKNAAKSGVLTDEQIDYFLEREIIIAKNRAAKFFSTFYAQPEEIKLILVDMSYNLGNRLHGFIKFQAAIDSYDYGDAAAELFNSKWFGQVGKRSKHHYHQLLEIRAEK